MNDTIWSTDNSSQKTSNLSAGQSYRTSGSSLSQLSSEKVTIVLKCSTLLLIAMAGVFGNTLTLTAIRTTPRLWTKSNMLLASLTSAHLYMSVIQFPYFAIFNLWVYVFAENSCYYFKAIVCIYPIPKIVAHAIFCQFIIIAADRYVAIVYPLHYETKMTDTVIKCLIGGSYVFGLTMSGIYFSYLQYIDWSVCRIPYSTVMTAGIDCSVLFTVMLVTILVYGRILLIAFKHRSKISSMTVTAQETSNQIQTIPVPTGGESAVVPGSETGKPKIRKTLKEFKAARMTVVLVFAYTLPLLPYEIGRIMQACGNMQPYTVKLVDVGSAIGNINIGFDWVIYGIMNRSFRQAFLRVLKIKTDDLNSD